MKPFFLAISLLGGILSLDATVQRGVQAARRPWMEGPMRAATGIGKPWIVAGTLAAIGFLDPGQGPRTVLAAVLALAPANLAVELLKRATFRARPDGERKRSNASFPSSHAANAFALAAVFARRWRRAAPVFFGLAAVVAFSRIYLNRHFLSDVVVAAAIGVAYAWLAERWLSAREARRRALEAEGDALVGNSGG